ncbi:MAG: hypothetical protein OXF79_02715 [Chloroflexi bacterium]|nr:hypothetical protein [Chloroflexota bacterium]
MVDAPSGPRPLLFPRANVLSEGFFFAPDGSAVNTIYMDLAGTHDYGKQSLVKLGRKRHRLASYKSIRLSRPSVFRADSEGLIADEREGVVDLDRQGGPGEIHFGRDTLIYCVSLWPPGGNLRVLRRAFPADYNGASRICRPRQFAQAVGLAMCEHLGAHGAVQPFRDQFDGFGTRHYERVALGLVHGPVLYSDQKARLVMMAETPLERLATLLLTKPSSHAAQDEYRYIVMQVPEHLGEVVDLPVSGMMRDCLRPLRRTGTEERVPVRAELVPESDTPP